MKRPLILLLMVLLLEPIVASVPDGSTKPASETDKGIKRVEIKSVEISGRRPMSEIGLQRTQLDSTILRERINSSLADALGSGSNIFIKSHGRATLSTASFRGTAPSHTQVTWNGMTINSPMMGQVDFSMIPVYLVDRAELYHGASSVGVTGGGLGGAVTLATETPKTEGFGLKYVQGAGSFSSFDEFLQFTYRGSKLSTSTRLLFSTSENDFSYRNYNSKQFTTDPDGNITGSYYPLQRNRGGEFSDLHAMQELYHTTQSGDRFSLAAWFTDSHRGLAMLSSDRNTDRQKRNTQDESTLRATASWERIQNSLKIVARIGYTYTDLRYLMLMDPEGNGQMRPMTDARSSLHTLYAHAGGEYAIDDRWLFTANVTAHQHRVRSGDMSVIDNITGERADTLYLQSRFELSTFGAIKWRPIPNLGVAANLRWELCGDRTSPIIPALFIDYLLSQRGGVVIKASASRNHRFPTLNDLYFRPGGNPSLRPEQGWSMDTGGEFSLKGSRSTLRGSATWFDSRINDWILWVGSAKTGIYTPLNIRRVHSYGIESKLTASTQLGSQWRLSIDANYAFTRSINQGHKFSPADQSVGKQLVYIPQHSATMTARVEWKRWTASYKWNFYSQRYTMSSNDLGNLSSVEPYFMSDLSIERSLDYRWASLSLKGCIHNLLNEEYETILSRPMPRLNWSIFVSITPKFSRHATAK